MKHGVLVIGPAGAGKSTFCSLLQIHMNTIKRHCHVINMDPAAERLPYDASGDVRDLITVGDVMEELGLGPNGGLVYCFEYLIQEDPTWLTDLLDDFEDDFLVLDCPGQVETLPYVNQLSKEMIRSGYSMATISLMDSHFITDISKYVSGALSCLSSMALLSIPHINVLSKCDLVSDQDLESFLDADLGRLQSELPSITSRALDTAIVDLLFDYDLVSFLPLNPKSPEAMEFILAHIDLSVQYGEDLEPVLVE